MWKLAVLVSLITLSTPARADVTLNLVGVYGDEAGCAWAQGADDWPTDSGVYLTPDKYGGYEWSCRFVWSSGDTPLLSKSEDPERPVYMDDARLWSVITLCSSEGEAFSELLSIQEGFDRNTVAIRSGSGSEPTILSRCDR